MAILRDGSTVFQAAYGSADLRSHRPIDQNTAFGLASMSKQFTAAAVGMLVVERKLSLDDDVRKYIPELPRYGHPVLLRDLVYHTSGFRDYISLTEDLSDYVLNGGRRWEQEMLVLLGRQKALNFQPGTHFSYNNSNYFLLSLVVKRVTGTPLGQFANERIFKPLGMKNTFFQDSPLETPPDRAIAYAPSDRQGFLVATPSAADYPVGDAGVVTTLSDLEIWDREFYRSSLGGAALHQLLMTRGKLRDGTELTYAFGIYEEASPAGPKVYHGGNGGGFRTRFVRYPDQRSSVFCLCNVSDAPTNRLVEGLTAIHLGLKAPQMKEAPFPGETREVQGYYRDSSTMGIWSFQAKGSRLVAQLVGVPGERVLFRVGSREFTTSDESFKARFHATARVVELSEYGRPATAFHRTEMSSPSRLADYVGRYTSDEIDATYELGEVGGRLAVRSPKAAAANLSPTVPDSFTGFGNYFFFQRKDGVVTSLVLGENTGRVRNLVLKKEASK